MKWIITFILIVLVIWIAALIGALYIFPDWQLRGQFGDTFGAVNALFSGLAFAGLLVAITLQRQELALQRKELQLQREEMQKSREELANQAQLQKEQLLVTLAELKLRAKMAEISALEMESLGLKEDARADRFGKQIRKVVENMQDTIDQLYAGLKKV